MANTVNVPAFEPVPGGTVTLSVTASSGNKQWNAGNLSRHCRIYNPSTTVTVFVEFGDSAVAATTTTSAPVGPGQTQVFASGQPYVAAIGSAAGPTTVYFTPGEGRH